MPGHSGGLTKWFKEGWVSRANKYKKINGGLS